MDPSAPLQWHPLESLAPRFGANLGALKTRDSELAERLEQLAVSRPFFIAAQGDHVFLGRGGSSGIERIADPVPPPAARSLARQAYPNAEVGGPLAVCGLGYGWLWDCLAKLQCKVDVMPGHRPPIYLLAGDIEQLWAVLHVMDWRAMLADRRLPIFAGPDALEQFQRKLIADPTWPAPRGLIRVDPSLPAQDLNDFTKALRQVRDEQLSALYSALDKAYAHPRGNDWPLKLAAGRLRVLGITSRYTTFLQHSMRDWLAAFDRLGHETRLAIEEQDHLILGPYGYARAIHDFNPDLILIIDHYRAEIGNIPKSVPCVMWVQDPLPNIYNDFAGAAQGPRDFCIGFGRLQLAQQHGYPADRFMSCPIGINEERFKPPALSEQDWARYGCDVSYVSHASTPSDVILKNALAKNSEPSFARLLWDFHDRLLGNFEQGGVTHAEWQLKEKLNESIARTGVEPSADKTREILWLFTLQINNAMLRHQALKWVADLDVQLKLYGNGWEKHPALGRFACGPADTLCDVPKICAASKVNLQITPHGSVHQRLLEGLIAGGFYLIRWTQGDQLGTAFRSLRNWCLSHGIGSESALRSIDDPQVQRWINECDELSVDHTDKKDFRLYDHLTAGGEAELMARAGAVWPEEYPRVSFRSAAELQSRLTRFLGDPGERKLVASAMRAAILENYTYVNISKRLVRFIAADLHAGASEISAAA